MALARLCDTFAAQNPKRISFHAFVVDHKARPDSTAEAEEVVKSLRGWAKRWSGTFADESLHLN
jgi:hypothetical protein